MLRYLWTFIIFLTLHSFINAQDHNEELENAVITVSYVNKVISYTENYYSYLELLSEYNFALLEIRDPENTDQRNRILTENPSLPYSDVIFLEIKYPLSHFNEKDKIYLKNDLMLYRSTINFLTDLLHRSLRTIQLQEEELQFSSEIEKYVDQSNKKIKNLRLLHERIVKTALKYGEPADLVILLNEKNATPYVQIKEENVVETAIINNKPEIKLQDAAPPAIPVNNSNTLDISAVADKSRKNEPTAIKDIPESAAIAYKEDVMPVSSFSSNYTTSDPNIISEAVIPNIFTYTEFSSPDELMLNDLTEAGNLFDLYVKQEDQIISLISELVKLKSIIVSRNRFISLNRATMSTSEVQRFRNFYSVLDQNYIFKLNSILKKYKNNITGFNSIENISIIEKALQDLQNTYNEGSYAY